MIASSVIKTIVGLAVLAAMLIEAVRFVAQLSASSRARRLVATLFPASQVLMTAALLWGSNTPSAPQWIFASTVILGLACVPVDRSLFTAIESAEQRDIENARELRLAEQLKTQEAVVSELRATTAEAQVILAEIEGKLDDVERSLAAHEAQGSTQKLEDIARLTRGHQLRFCEHNAINALANVKKRDLDRLDVKTSMQLEVPADLAVSSAELCAVFANIFDNAIAACESCPEADRFFRISSHRSGAFFLIDAINSSRGQSGRAKDAATQSKAAPSPPRPGHDGGIPQHGWGISIIRQVAERLDGAVSIEEEPDSFRISVMLNLAAAK